MEKPVYTNDELKQMLEASITREANLTRALGEALKFLPPHGCYEVYRAMSGGK